MCVCVCVHVFSLPGFALPHQDTTHPLGQVFRCWPFSVQTSWTVAAWHAWKHSRLALNWIKKWHMSVSVLSNHNSTWGQSYSANCSVVFVPSSALAVVKIISFSQVGADFLDSLTIVQPWKTCICVHVCACLCQFVCVVIMRSQLNIYVWSYFSDHYTVSRHFKSLDI